MVETENGKFQPCADFNKFLCSWMEVLHWNVPPEALCSLLWQGPVCRGMLPNASLLLTLLNFLTAVFFCSVGQEAGEEVSMFSLFHIPAMQFEFATTHVLLIGTIIMLIWPHANQCWTWLVFMLLHMYLKCTAVKWYTTSFSFSKSPLGLNIQGSYASCSMRVNPVKGFLKPNWRTGQKMGQFN